MPDAGRNNDPECAWWGEDAARHNALCDMAQAMNLVDDAEEGDDDDDADAADR